MAKWTEEQKLKALAIAEASSTAEAEEQTGIPAATIRSWRKRMNHVAHVATENATQRNATPKKIQKLTEEVMDEAKAEVKEYIVDRVKQVSDGLLELVELAKDEAVNLIQTGHDPADSKAQWLRSVVGAIAQGVEKHQLLEGKPTQRSEVNGHMKTTQEQQYHVIQEVVSQDDEVADRLLSAFRGQRSKEGSSQGTS